MARCLSVLGFFHLFFPLKLKMRVRKRAAGGERENRDTSFLWLTFEKRDTAMMTLGDSFRGSSGLLLSDYFQGRFR